MPSVLSKRQKAAVLTELPREEWPEKLILRQGMLERDYPEWIRSKIRSFLYDTELGKYRVPNGKAMVDYRFTDFETMRDSLFLYDGKTRDYRILGPFESAVDRVVWVTREDHLVVLFHPILSVKRDAMGVGRLAGRGYVSALDENGKELWHFEPEIEPDRVMNHIASAPDGVITLYAGRLDGIIKAEAVLWQIDGETGKLLQTCRFPPEEDCDMPVYAREMNAFVYVRRADHSLVVLDAELREICHIADYEGSYYPQNNQFSENRMWTEGEGDTLLIYDLKNGTKEKVLPETKVYAVMAVLRDGRILKVNKKQNRMTVFSPDGHLLAKCSVPGEIRSVAEDHGRVYVAELRGPLYGDFMEESSYFQGIETHVWRLDIK